VKLTPGAKPCDRCSPVHIIIHQTADKPRHKYKGQRPRWKYSLEDRDETTFLGWHGEHDLWHWQGFCGYVNATTAGCDMIGSGWQSTYSAPSSDLSPAHAAALITARTRAAWLGLCPPLRDWLKDKPRFKCEADGYVYLGRDRDNDDLYWRGNKAYFTSYDDAPCPPTESSENTPYSNLARSRARDLGLAVGLSEEEKQAKRQEIEAECDQKIIAAREPADRAERLARGAREYADEAMDRAVAACNCARAERDRKLAELDKP